MLPAPIAVMDGHRPYTVANTHSHNDYEQPTPFWMAYQEQFGSIEADIFWLNGQLIVAHSLRETQAGRTLEEYYIKPLQSCLLKNGGHPFADTSRQLQMMIDIKTDSIATLNALIELLKKYPAVINTPFVKWVISGNRPTPSLFTSYPSFIWFDGVLHSNYSKEELSRVAMLSDDLRHYTRWDGQTEVPAADWKTLQEAVSHSHSLGIPVRFWDAPDFPHAWDQLIHLQVDYINTDHIAQLAAYLKEHPTGLKEYSTPSHPENKP